MENIPLQNFFNGHWALINIILGALSVIFTLLVVAFCLKDKITYKKKLSKKCIFSKIFNLIFTSIIMGLFHITEDFTGEMQLVDNFTLITIIIFLLQLFVFMGIETIGENKKTNEDG